MKEREIISFYCTDNELQIIKLCIGGIWWYQDIKRNGKGNEEGGGWESVP